MCGALGIILSVHDRPSFLEKNFGIVFALVIAGRQAERECRLVFIPRSHSVFQKRVSQNKGINPGLINIYALNAVRRNSALN